MIKTCLKTLGLLAVLFAVSIAFFEWMFWNGLTVRTHTVETDVVMKRVRIAVIADFHNSSFGTSITDALAKAKPDIVVIPGDLDSSWVLNENARALLSVIGREYPCYYVMGNHEFLTGRVGDIVGMVTASGATALRGESALVSANGQNLRIAGLDDPEGLTDDQWSAQLAACAADAGDGIFTILLTHRPELVDRYRDSGFDLAIAGHAHGGQVRIPPFMKSLYAPNQGLLPPYAGGHYDFCETTMIVSRGLKN